MELKSGKKLEASLVVVGVGAKPNTELFKGQLDLLEDKPGGVKVFLLHYLAPFVSADLSIDLLWPRSLVNKHAPTSDSMLVLWML